VPVVEDLAEPGLLEVDADDLGLDPDRPLDQLGQQRTVRVERRLGLPADHPTAALDRNRSLQQFQDPWVGDEAAFDHLGQPGEQVVGRQGVQGFQVAQHPGGRVERADQVFAGRHVDPGLAAHRRVDHAEQRGRDRHPAHPAQPAGGHEAGQVGDRATADADHHVRTREVGRAQLIPAGGGDVDGLARLGVRHLDQQRLDPARGGDPLGTLAQRGGEEDRGLRRAVDQRAQLAADPPPDQHVIGTIATHRDSCHHG
jgi:hypothetical protein